MKIGKLSIDNKAFLAPMSGITDWPFRRLAAQFGAGMVVSEMIPCADHVKPAEETRLRLEGAGLDLHVVQLSGRAEADMVAGVTMAEAAGADLIDINMGCPAKRVTGGQGGSALMRDLAHATRLIAATVAAATVPVTVKMRLGWDESTINAPELARRAEDLGVAMITVHGRTRCQFYNGRADWNRIGEVVDAISVPVVANGDLQSEADAGSMLAASGAQAVMIGRGAQGRPWLPGRISAVLDGRQPPPEPRGSALRDLILDHYEAILVHHGVGHGLRSARKHLDWYLRAAGIAGRIPDLRARILRSLDPEEVRALITAAFDDAHLAGEPAREAA